MKKKIVKPKSKKPRPKDDVITVPPPDPNAPMISG